MFSGDMGLSRPVSGPLKKQGPLDKGQESIDAVKNVYFMFSCTDPPGFYRSPFLLSDLKDLRPLN